MNIHEYQAKARVARLRRAGAARHCGLHASRRRSRPRNELGGPVWVVKAQIHAGGRGKGGGVKVVKSRRRRAREAERLLGTTLVTHQTGPHGKEVQPPLHRGRLGDRARVSTSPRWSTAPTSRVAFVASTEGGMDIEEVARTRRRKRSSRSRSIRRPASWPITAVRSRARSDLAGEIAKQAETLLPKLYQAFLAKDMSLLEINPLVVTKTGELICLDAKISFDDNALYRHPDIVALRDLSEEDAKEIEASQATTSTTSRSTAPSAAWSTAPASPWRRWTSSSSTARRRPTSSTSAAAPPRSKVTAAFKIITSDPNVKGILVNIFGGIMRCDIIAEGVVAAVKEVGLRVPLVVRLEGTNVDARQEDPRRNRPQRHRRPTTSTTPRRRSSRR